MLKLKNKKGRYYYSVLNNPIARVMKFERFFEYFSDLKGGGTVLDYGSGDQPLKDFLKTKYGNYISADYLPSNASHSVLPDVEIVNDGQIEIKSNSIDCVVMTEVLEHIYSPKDVLSELHRVLKNNGTLIGTVPFSIGEHEQPYDFHRYTSFCLIRMFEESGFSVKSVDYIGDGVGVSVVNFSHIFLIFPKALNKIGFVSLSKFIAFIINLPGIIYFFIVKAGVDPQKIPYYKKNPFGFVFFVTKKS